jgi:hypothetical protein
MIADAPPPAIEAAARAVLDHCVAHAVTGGCVVTAADGARLSDLKIAVEGLPAHTMAWRIASDGGLVALLFASDESSRCRVLIAGPDPVAARAAIAARLKADANVDAASTPVSLSFTPARTDRGDGLIAVVTTALP